MTVHKFNIEAAVAVGFGCAIYDWSLDSTQIKEVFKFIVAEGTEWTSGAMFLEHLGIDFRELRAGLHRLVCECVWDEDFCGNVDLHFNLISIK